MALFRNCAGPYEPAGKFLPRLESSPRRCGKIVGKGMPRICKDIRNLDGTPEPILESTQKIKQAREHSHAPLPKAATHLHEGRSFVGEPHHNTSFVARSQECLYNSVQFGEYGAGCMIPALKEGCRGRSVPQNSAARVGGSRYGWPEATRNIVEFEASSSLA